MDANPLFACLWKRHRPRDVFVNAAACGRREVVRFVRNDLRPGESSVTKGTDGADGGVGVAVQGMPLRDVVSQYEDVFSGGMDVLSIDCEGLDMEVLESLDFSLCRPFVVVMEVLDGDSGGRVSERMASMDYCLVGQLRYSRVFRSN